MVSRQPQRHPRGNGRTDPVTGLPTSPDSEDGAPRRDWRIRAVGLVAALLIALAALIYFFDEREFSPVVIALVVLAGLAAIVQSVMVLLEFRQR